MKTFSFLLIVLMASIFWGMYLSATYKYQYALNSTENTPISTTAETSTPTTSTPETEATKPPVQTTTPTTPVAVKPKCGSGGTCMATDISPHNTKTDCWVYLSPINKVYDVTEYVSNPKKHPGGDVIIPYCGTNIYDVFIKKDGGHAHSNNALENILQGYYIGEFQS
jgi:hypothetical protein